MKSYKIFNQIIFCDEIDYETLNNAIIDYNKSKDEIYYKQIIRFLYKSLFVDTNKQQKFISYKSMLDNLKISDLNKIIKAYNILYDLRIQLIDCIFDSELSSREKYYKEHQICPKCQNQNPTIISALACQIPLNENDYSNFQDENSCACQCGWRGITHELIPSQ